MSYYIYMSIGMCLGAIVGALIIKFFQRYQ